MLTSGTCLRSTHNRPAGESAEDRHCGTASDPL